MANRQVTVSGVKFRDELIKIFRAQTGPISAYKIAKLRAGKKAEDTGGIDQKLYRNTLYYIHMLEREGVLRMTGEEKSDAPLPQKLYELAGMRKSKEGRKSTAEQKR